MRIIMNGREYLSSYVFYVGCAWSESSSEFQLRQKKKMKQIFVLNLLISVVLHAELDSLHVAPIVPAYVWSPAHG